MTYVRFVFQMSVKQVHRNITVLLKSLLSPLIYWRRSTVLTSPHVHWRHFYCYQNSHGRTVGCLSEHRYGSQLVIMLYTMCGQM